jgi:hypothetical protein
MALIEDYRDKADECRRLAETESDPSDRSVWLLLQSAWIRLSDEAPGMLEAEPPPSEALPAGPRERKRG